MSTTTREERLERRIENLTATDPQFAAAKPDPAVIVTLDQPGLRLPQVIQTVLEGYDDRLALGQRAVEFVKDPKTGRTVRRLLPRFDTLSYGELRDRVDGVVRALTRDGLQPGDRVAALGFNSVDFTTIDVALAMVGAVSVPLQTSAALAQLQPIVTETEPAVFAASTNQLSDAVELILSTDHRPSKLVVFDYHPEVDNERDAVDSARARLADAVTVELLADLLQRGKALPATPAADVDDDELALLICTSGQYRRPQGRDVPPAQRRQDVAPVEPQLLRRDRRIDHPQLHADEPRDGPGHPVRRARQRRHGLLRRPQRPVDTAGRPRAGAAHRR